MDGLIERDDIRVIITALDTYLNEGIGEKDDEERAVKLAKAFQELLTNRSDQLFQLS